MATSSPASSRPRTRSPRTPYVWGGGHGGASGGYDCSGSISYALAAGGLLSGALDSTGFMSWGEAGPGRRITVYANAGHAFMVVDGRRYDTSALSGGGTRWTSRCAARAGFVARHPPGSRATSPRAWETPRMLVRGVEDIQVVQEQAALLRIAMLVARDEPLDSLFGAVSAEVVAAAARRRGRGDAASSAASAR